MELILDGNYEIGTEVMSNLLYLICFKAFDEIESIVLLCTLFFSNFLSLIKKKQKQA